MLETANLKSAKFIPKKRPIIFGDGLGFNLTDDVLHFFGVKGIRFIAQVEAKELYAKMAMNPSLDLDSFMALMENEQRVPSNFYDALNSIYLLKSRQTFDHLDHEGFTRNENETDGEYLCRLYATKKTLYATLLKRVDKKLNTSEISFTLSQITKPPTKEKDIFDNLYDQLEQSCSRFFHSQGYTEHAILRPFKSGRREGFYIERGSHANLVPLLENSERVSRQIILRKVDTVFYDIETGVLGVYSKGQRATDIAFYQSLAAGAITGNAAGFQNMNFNMKLLKSSGLRSILNQRRVNIERIIIKKAHFPNSSDTCISSPLAARGGRMKCVTDKPDFPEFSQKIPVFTGAEFKLIINEDKNLTDVIHVCNGRLQLGGLLSLDQVLKLLVDLKITEPFSHG